MTILAATTTTEPEVETPVGSPIRGRYLYAIIDGGGEREPLGFEGVDGAEVYAVGDGQVSAIVSDLPDRKVRPERRKIAAHHDVLKRLMADHTVLPMAFGLIADGPESVKRILRLNASTFDSQIRRLQGKVEMGLRVSWDVPNIFEYALRIHTELAELRDHLFRGGREPSQDEKIEVGRTFERLINEDREAHTDRVTSILAARCAEMKVGKIRGDREVLNLACLVNRDAMKEFEAGVIEAARSFDNNFAFDFNGPWPPHNFVDIELRIS